MTQEKVQEEKIESIFDKRINDAKIYVKDELGLEHLLDEENKINWRTLRYVAEVYTPAHPAELIKIVAENLGLLQYDAPAGQRTYHVLRTTISEALFGELFVFVQKEMLKHNKEQIEVPTKGEVLHFSKRKKK